MEKTVQISQGHWRLMQWASLAVLVHFIEAALPSPLPGLKPGLANVIVLLVFFLFGLRAAWFVALLKVFAGSIILGSFLSPGFWLSLGGMVFSMSIMSLVCLGAGLGLSAIGVSMLCALAHMGGQFLLAYMLFIPHEGLFKLLPLLLSAAWVFGLLTGIVAQRLLIRLRKHYELTDRQRLAI